MAIAHGENEKSSVEVTIEDGRVCVSLSRYGICLERRSFSSRDLIDAGFASRMLNSSYGTFDLHHTGENDNEDS